MWRRLGSDFTFDWAQVAPRVLSVVQAGREAAVRVALPYTDSVLSETGVKAPAASGLVAARFVRDAPDGRNMQSLLNEAVILSRSAVRDGATVREALTKGGAWLTGTTLTVMADTRRQVYHADVIQRRGIGYARMLNPPSCSRCAVLAGRWYEWNKGFLRHPRCDCIHIPSPESVGQSFTTDPAAYFESLPVEQQDRLFTKSGAQAIRDGADLARVVNVNQRGLNYAKARAGLGTRLTVDDIYRMAGSRAEAIQLLRSEGYVNLWRGV